MRLHGPGAVLEAQEHAADQDREGVVPVVDAEVLERADRATDAGVVEDAVDPAELRRRESDHGLHVGLLGDVGHDEADALAMARLGGTLERLLARRVVHVGDHHARALVEEAERGRPSHATGAAGDDGDLALQPIRHVWLPSAR